MQVIKAVIIMIGYVGRLIKEIYPYVSFKMVLADS